MTELCGCHVVSGYRVQRCALHDAAPELLAALKVAVRRRAIYSRDVPVEWTAAIQKAEAKDGA
jgi:hypothetical protein